MRFLEQKTIERLDGNQSLTSNARVIAATHVNLEQAVSEATPSSRWDAYDPSSSDRESGPTAFPAFASPPFLTWQALHRKQELFLRIPPATSR